MLKKVTNTTLYNSEQYHLIHSFLQKVFLRIYWNMILQGCFVISDIVFRYDDTIYNPSPVWELSLLTQFSGITTLQSLFSEKQCKEPWPIKFSSMRSDDLTHNPSPSSY